MNRLYDDDKIKHSLRSFSSLQSALLNYLNSYLTLLEAEFNKVDHQIIADNLYKIMRNVNELQKLLNERMELFSQQYSEAEINYFFKEFQELNQKDVPQSVNNLYNVSKKYSWPNGKKKKVNDEFHQYFLTYKKQRKKLNTFRSFQNDLTKLWIVDIVGCPGPITKECNCNSED